MESVSLRIMKPTTKLLPVHLRAPVYCHPYASGSAFGPGWRSSKTAAQAVERRRPERAAMAEEELEKELEREGFWEWMEMEKCRECGEVEDGGVVEVMECLEREAIMGEDQGKDPIDYSRRATIFDKSSQIFQALNPPQIHSNSS